METYIIYIVKITNPILPCAGEKEPLTGGFVLHRADTGRALNPKGQQSRIPGSQALVLMETVRKAGGNADKK